MKEFEGVRSLFWLVTVQFSLGFSRVLQVGSSPGFGPVLSSECSPSTPPKFTPSRHTIHSFTVHNIQSTVSQFHDRAREHQNTRKIHTRTRVRTKNKGLVYPRPQQGSGLTAFNRAQLHKSQIANLAICFSPALRHNLYRSPLLSPPQSQPVPSGSLRSPPSLRHFTVSLSPPHCHTRYLFRVQRKPKER